jgi:hypothetical protein
MPAPDGKPSSRYGGSDVVQQSSQNETGTAFWAMPVEKLEYRLA